MPPNGDCRGAAPGGVPRQPWSGYTPRMYRGRQRASDLSSSEKTKSKTHARRSKVCAAACGRCPCCLSKPGPHDPRAGTWRQTMWPGDKTERRRRKCGVAGSYRMSSRLVVHPWDVPFAILALWIALRKDAFFSRRTSSITVREAPTTPRPAPLQDVCTASASLYWRECTSVKLGLRSQTLAYAHVSGP